MWRGRVVLRFVCGMVGLWHMDMRVVRRRCLLQKRMGGLPVDGGGGGRGTPAALLLVMLAMFMVFLVFVVL